MKAALHGSFLLLCAALQSTLFNHIAIFDVIPNLFLVYVIVISFFCGKFEAAVIGAVFGLVLDILSAKFLGANMILFLLLAFSVSLFCERVIRKNSIFITAAAVLIMSFIYETVYYMFVLLFANDVSLFSVIINVILVESLYNALIVFVLYHLICHFARGLYIDKGEGIG